MNESIGLGSRRAAGAAGVATAWLVVCLLLLAAGCASTGVVPIGANEYPAKARDCSLDVFSSRQDVQREFEAVCLVSTESGSTLFNDRTTKGRMREIKAKACECGADAIVITEMGRTATQFGRGYSQAQITAEAIVYK